MTLTVDLHGLTEAAAIKVVEKTIASAPKTCEAVVVIHGHQGGQALKRMLQDPNKIRSRRIKRRKYTQNPGETILELYVD